MVLVVGIPILLTKIRIRTSLQQSNILPKSMTLKLRTTRVVSRTNSTRRSPLDSARTLRAGISSEIWNPSISTSSLSSLTTGEVPRQHEIKKFKSYRMSWSYSNSKSRRGSSRGGPRWWRITKVEALAQMMTLGTQMSTSRSVGRRPCKRSRHRATISLSITNRLSRPRTPMTSYMSSCITR